MALAQLRKLDGITERLRRNKKRLKDAISDIPNLSFRVIHGADEEVGTILTLLFPDKEKADAFTAKVGQKTLAHSGWHVYNNMEQILAAGNYHKHMLPQTDAILERAANVSIGVVDNGLGSAFGIHILSTDAEIDAVAQRIREICAEIGL